jgi:hypothetical protein
MLVVLAADVSMDPGTQPQAVHDGVATPPPPPPAAEAGIAARAAAAAAATVAGPGAAASAAATDALSGGSPGSGYMAKEEQAQHDRLTAQEFLLSIMADAAPAAHVPMLLALLAPESQAPVCLKVGACPLPHSVCHLLGRCFTGVHAAMRSEHRGA